MFPRLAQSAPGVVAKLPAFVGDGPMRISATLSVLFLLGACTNQSTPPSTKAPQDATVRRLGALPISEAAALLPPAAQPCFVLHYGVVTAADRGDREVDVAADLAATCRRAATHLAGPCAGYAQVASAYGSISATSSSPGPLQIAASKADQALAACITPQ